MMIIIIIVLIIIIIIILVIIIITIIIIIIIVTIEDLQGRERSKSGITQGTFPLTNCSSFNIDFSSKSLLVLQE